MFGPTDLITREQIAVMMYRFAEFKGYDTEIKMESTGFLDEKDVSGFAKEAMPWAVEKQLITGDDRKLNPQGATSRAVCATILQRFLNKMVFFHCNTHQNHLLVFIIVNDFFCQPFKSLLIFGNDGNSVKVSSVAEIILTDRLRDPLHI